MAHNGEINTLKGNKNWMFARQGVMQSELFGDDLNKLFPVVEAHCSDSGTFDNAMEFLYHGGRTLQEVAMLMIPEAWQNHHNMAEPKRAFYEYYSALQEPWDGPASVSFTDGKYIGACLDRNGLRPSRYYVTHDDKVVMASEVGVLDVDPANVKIKGRLQPGKMFLVDFEEGRLIPDEELKRDVSTRRPYVDWLKRQRMTLDELPRRDVPSRFDDQSLLEQMQAFGYTTETLQFMLIPLIKARKDPINSMGNDAALACMSDKPRMLYDYFKQLFAQVTNPAIDSIREEIVMSLECFIGPEGNLLETSEEQCHRLAVPHPILTDEELAAIRNLDYRGWRTKTIDIAWPKSEGVSGLLPAIDRICAEAEQAIADGFSLIVLTDRACSAETRAGERASGVWSSPPSSSPQGTADADRHCAGDRRGARGAPFLPADGIRGRRGQSLPRFRSDSRRAPARRTQGQLYRGEDRRHVSQGRLQGDAQGDGQDGDLDAAELQGSADLRSAGAG